MAWIPIKATCATHLAACQHACMQLKLITHGKGLARDTQATSYVTLFLASKASS